jgi:hypothetical protein
MGQHLRNIWIAGSSHVRSGSHGRSCDVVVSPGSRDSSLPRCYVNEQFDDSSQSAEDSAAEDSRSQVASNQLVVEVPVVVEVRFDVGRIIGDGNFAVVRQGVDRRNGGRFALKLIDKKRCQVCRFTLHPDLVGKVERKARGGPQAQKKET